MIIGRHALPDTGLHNGVVLDIGCFDGEVLALPHFNVCKELHGIDRDADAIARGIKKRPYLRLQVGSADHLPYDDNTFTCVFSLVAFPYMDIERVIAECHRVLKPGGTLHLDLHDRRELKRKVRRLLGFESDGDRYTFVKPFMDLCYVAFNSTLFHFTGKVIARPWAKDRRETLQSVSRMRKLLDKGFTEILSGDTEDHYIIRATKRSNQSEGAL